MAYIHTSQKKVAEDFVAELTDAAYRVALKHGFQGTFIDVQLDLWAALRGVVLGELFLAEFPGLGLRNGLPRVEPSPAETVA